MRYTCFFLFIAMLAGSVASSAELLPPVRFQGKDTLLRPERYREWIFVGSSLGLSYQQDPGGGGTTQGETGLGLYHNVYIQPSSYKAFASSGRFPEGTVLVLELVTADVKKDPKTARVLSERICGAGGGRERQQAFSGRLGVFQLRGTRRKASERSTTFPEGTMLVLPRPKSGHRQRVYAVLSHPAGRRSEALNRAGQAVSARQRELLFVAQQSPDCRLQLRRN